MGIVTGCKHATVAYITLLSVGSLLTAAANYDIAINLDEPLATVDERYLSVSLDSSLIQRRWSTFDFASPKVHTLASALSPCYLRLGGTEADFLIFNPASRPVEMASGGGWLNDDRRNFNMSGKDWDMINSFARSVNWRLVFDLNVLIRDGKSGWDDSNARSLLNYSIQKGYSDNLDFQLGNELNLFPKLNRSLSATQLGQDFQHLWHLLRQQEFHHYYKQSIAIGPDVTNPSLHGSFENGLLIGPDVTRPSHVDRALVGDSAEYLKEFLSAVDHKIDVVSWHQYYFAGSTAHLSTFLDAKTMDVLTKQIAVMQGVMRETGHHNSTMWLSETSSAYGGGAPELSDRYVAGFLWLDKLGIAAREGIRVVVRQTFYGGSYSLIDDQLNPLPDFWLSLLYKRLVGSKVLSVTTNDKSRELRVYAHCSSKMTVYPSGSVTLYVLNVHNETVTAEVRPAGLESQMKLQYLLTPYGKEGLTSSTVALNGEPLRLIDDHTLPQLTPVTVPPHQPLTLPANTFGFWVFPAAEAKACV